jgi:hypothetical protein
MTGTASAGGAIFVSSARMRSISPARPMRAPRHWSTVRTVIEQAWYVFKRHWFALLVAAAMVETAVELVVRRNSDGAPTTSLWITVPLLAVMIVPLFWWRRFPFGAPAAVFVIGAAESFVDGRLVTFTS